MTDTMTTIPDGLEEVSPVYEEDDDVTLLTTELPEVVLTTKSHHGPALLELLDYYDVDVTRATLIFLGVILAFLLTGIFLFICEYRRRRKDRLKEIAIIREEDPDAVFDDENETFWMFLRKGFVDLQPNCQCSCNSDQYDKARQSPSDDSYLYPPDYQDIDDYARAPEASFEDSLISSSEDRQDRPSDLALTPSSLEDDEARELKILNDIAATGERSRKQLKKQKSEEKSATQIEIIFAKDIGHNEAIEMVDIDDDPVSETWFAEKFVEHVPFDM